MDSFVLLGYLFYQFVSIHCRATNKPPTASPRIILIPITSIPHKPPTTLHNIAISLLLITIKFLQITLNINKLINKFLILLQHEPILTLHLSLITIPMQFRQFPILLNPYHTDMTIIVIMMIMWVLCMSRMMGMMSMRMSIWYFVHIIHIRCITQCMMIFVNNWYWLISITLRTYIHYILCMVMRVRFSRLTWTYMCIDIIKIPLMSMSTIKLINTSHQGNWSLMMFHMHLWTAWSYGKRWLTIFIVIYIYYTQYATNTIQIYVQVIRMLYEIFGIFIRY